MVILPGTSKIPRDVWRWSSDRIGECTKAVPECLHCGREHRPGARECLKRQQEAIIKIQQHKEVSIAMARKQITVRIKGLV